ncbi:MAG TPA: hypothetical protein VHU83_02950 [Bryobacteraceae bacterium]|nr:hypothetical protein [Bryobacteraceae bacterium]
MCSDSWVDVSSEAYDWAGTNSRVRLARSLAIPERGAHTLGRDAGVEVLIALSKEPQVEVKSPARYSLWQLEQRTKDPALKERIRQALGEQQN